MKIMIMIIVNVDDKKLRSDFDIFEREKMHYCMFFVGTSCKRLGPQLVRGELVAKFLRGLKQMAF